MAKTKVVAKGVAGVMKPALEKLFVKQADDVAAKAAREAAEEAAEKAAKEAAEKAGKEATEEAAERAGKEAGEEAAEKAAKEARPPGTKCTGGDPIDLATGEVLLAATDAEFPGVLPLELVRTHLSDFRRGQLFGVSWASTLDQRLELDATQVVYASPEGMVLRFPAPDVPRVVERPVTGPQHNELVLAADGGYELTNVQTGQILHFPPPGRLGWAQLPLTAITDRNGNRIDFGYDEGGTLEGIEHSGGYRIAVDTRSYEGSARVIALRLLDGEQPGDIVLMRYGYDEAGNLAEVVNGSGKPLRYSYDGAHRMTGWINRNGHRYDYTYDSEGRALAGSGSGGYLGTRLEFRTSGAGRRTVVTDSLGASTVYEFNAAGQVTAITDPLGNTTRSEWDGFHRLLATTDARGHTRRYGYDERGNVTAVTGPDGVVSGLAYNELSLPVEVIGPGGATWANSYDERGNLTSVTDPAGATTYYRYDARGAVTGVRDPLGAITQITPNPAGLPETVTDPRGGVTRIARDVQGRVASVTDPVGGITRYTWTAEGKAASRTLPDGSIERWSYDAEGDLVEHIDPLGRSTRTENGPFHQPSARTAPDGVRLEFGYDTELRLTSVSHPQGVSWRYQYDAAGNLIGEIDFNGRRVAYSYDPNGELAARTNGAGETVTFARDVLGNVAERRAGDQVTTFTHDVTGRLESAVNPAAELRYVRDPLGRVLAEICNGNRVESRYDAAGRRTRRMTPSGATSLWTYDPGGLPATLTTGGQTIAFRYDAAGREVQRTIGGGVALTQKWDRAHRLTAQSIWGAPAAPGSPSRLLQHRAYTYRADGNVTAIGDRLTGERRFDLDAAGRITAVTAQGWSERYAYDSLGNITHAASPGTDDTSGDREYTGTLIRRAGRVRYEHDAQGRVVLREHVSLSGKASTWRYRWDTEDRMVGVRTPDGTVWRYLYDALGRRIAKDRLDGGGRLVERIDFVWDGATLAEQAHSVWTGTSWTATGAVWDYEQDGVRPAAQTLRVRDASQRWIDQRFQAIVADLVGSPAELVDSLGNVVPATRTSLWGSSGPGSDPAGCPLRFPGQYHDRETGLSYNVERYYDPADGRYRSPDPLGLAPQPNPHTYVRNPVAFADPLGLGPVPAQAPTGARFAHLDRPGFSNYLLLDKSQTPYYSGMFGPNDTPAGVQYRHGQNHNRFDPKQGDSIEVTPGTRTYGEARLKEQRLAEQHETIIGRDGDNYRGNRQNPLAGDKLAEYEAYEKQKINGGCP